MEDHVKAGDNMEMPPRGETKTLPEQNKKQSCWRRYYCSPVVFLTVLVISIVLKATATGYSSGVISTLEKRFQLKSTQVALIAMVEDIVGLSTVMVIVHFGQSRHRPRVIGTLTLIVAIGVALQAMPHFLYKLPLSLLQKPPQVENLNTTDTNNVTVQQLFCLQDGRDSSGGSQECTEEEKASSGSLIREAFWIPLGSSVISLGSGIGPISLTYLDDNVPKRTMPVYAGIVFSVFAFGSLFGFFLAGYCLSLPVTFPLYETEYYSASPGDPNWLGAWWMGYLICSFTLAVFGLLFFLFPRQLRDPEELRREDEEYLRRNPPLEAKKQEQELEEEQREASCGNGPIEFIKDFFLSLSHILKNVVVIALIISACLTAFSATGFMIFGPKFTQVVYELDPAIAPLVIGAFLVPGAMTGQIFGGIIIRRLNLTRYGMAKMLLMTATVMALSVVLFYTIRCDKRETAGLTVPYAGYVKYNEMNSPTFIEVSSEKWERNLTSTCNKDCECPGGQYQPVCGSDGVTYITPCHAGCNIMSADGNYTDCSCLPLNEDGHSYATPGQCDRPCKSWIFYIVACIPVSFLGTMAGTAGFMLQLRSVELHHRGLAMSFGNVLIKVLGYIPGPLVFGFFIEKACLFYQSLCGRTGNCIVYDSDYFLNGFNSVVLGVQILGYICVLVAFFTVRRQTKKEKDGFKTVPSSANDETSNV
ncbi:Solute carrier organic anion transporter family member 3A1 [Holothuria leucospilota]|uniref:Solute carrier organic anion transporter family member n=1 Tax=Holothuria leucospilota TaxID=206669 RepID=A0A9Q1CI85_HOLLE|nr:Solute carrier organic anion transporter family member 3A1 [Holothuria leucospilota]